MYWIGAVMIVRPAQVGQTAGAGRFEPDPVEIEQYLNSQQQQT